MTHPSPEHLALLALGDDVDDDVAAHLRECPTCAAELASLHAVVAAGRRPPTAAELVPPPPDLWERISAASAADDVEPAASATEPVAGDPAGVDPGSPSDPASPPVADVPARARRTGRSWAPVLAAVAAGVVVGAGSVLGWQALTDPAEQTPTDEVIATIGLQAEPGGVPGSATLVETSAGWTLRVSIEQTPGSPTDPTGSPADDRGDEGEAPEPEAGFQQVWLLSADGTGMVALGVLHDGVGTMTVPADVDLRAFPVIDVSTEPYDGDPAHSGHSLARGALPAG